MSKDYEDTKAAQGAMDALKLGSVCESMAISGTVIYTSGEGAVIENLTIDEKTLAIRLASYTSSKGNTDLSLQKLVDSYNANGEEFRDYNAWYGGEIGKKEANSYTDAVKKALDKFLNVKSLDSASVEQVEEAIGFVEEALEELGYDTVTENNLDAISKWMDGAYNDEPEEEN